MEKFREEKINKLIRKELSEIFLREFELPKDSLITVDKVEVDEKFKKASVYLSIFPEKAKKNLFPLLVKKIYFFQKELNRRLKIYSVPQIIFIPSPTLKN